jgi:hypothetical protein
MQLFTVAFQSVSNFFIFATATAVSALFVYIFLKAAMSAESRSAWARRITSPNAKFVFAFLFIVWAVGFGIGLQLVPHIGANSPYGGLGLIALFSGFFIMMGFLWAVIGE